MEKKEKQSGSILRKRAAMVLCGCAALLFCACLFGAWAVLRQPAAPVLTENVTGLVIAKTGNRIVLQTDEAQQASRIYTIGDTLIKTFAVGDTVMLCTELHADNAESVIAVTPVQTGGTVDAQIVREAEAALENEPNVP